MKKYILLLSLLTVLVVALAIAYFTGLGAPIESGKTVILILFGLLVAALWIYAVYKSKKSSKTEPDKRPYVMPLTKTSQKPAEPVNGFACARCGIDLNLINRDAVYEIDGKQYCDVCSKIVSEQNEKKNGISADNARINREEYGEESNAPDPMRDFGMALNYEQTVSETDFFNEWFDKFEELFPVPSGRPSTEVAYIAVRHTENKQAYLIKIEYLIQNGLKFKAYRMSKITGSQLKELAEKVNAKGFEKVKKRVFDEAGNPYEDVEIDVDFTKDEMIISESISEHAPGTAFGTNDYIIDPDDAVILMACLSQNGADPYEAMSKIMSKSRGLSGFLKYCEKKGIKCERKQEPVVEDKKSETAQNVEINKSTAPSSSQKPAADNRSGELKKTVYELMKRAEDAGRISSIDAHNYVVKKLREYGFDPSFNELFALETAYEREHPDAFPYMPVLYKWEKPYDTYESDVVYYNYHPSRHQLYSRFCHEVAAGCGHGGQGKYTVTSWKTLLNDLKEHPGDWKEETWQSICADYDRFPDMRCAELDELRAFRKRKR